jgi:sulfite reductase alpha subunit-like flavoprotein
MARYPLVPDSIDQPFRIFKADLEQARFLARQRDVSVATVLRDTVHVGLEVRRPLAQAILALSQLDLDDGDCLHVGPERDPAVLERHTLIRKLFELYGDVEVGQVVPKVSKPNPEESFYSEEKKAALANVERAEQRREAAERDQLITELLRTELGLPEASPERAVEELADLFALSDFSD